MAYTEWIGMLAGICTTLAFAPQAWKAWREKDTRAISLPMYVIFLLGVTLWFAYGWLIGSWPIVVNNAASFLLASLVLLAKLRHG